MKIISLSALLVLFSITTLAQSPPPAKQEAAPGLDVLEKKWHKEFYNPAMYEDPFSANDERRQAIQDQRDANRINSILMRQGQSAVRVAPRVKPIETAADAPSQSFIYTAKVKNTGNKTISSVEWEYLFLDAATNEIIGHHRYLAKINIRPDRGVNLVGQSDAPPAGVIKAGNSGKNKGERYAEQIIIHRIEYADGTVWQRQ